VLSFLLRPMLRVAGSLPRTVMGVDALSEVVAADRGRASELLQARKALQQAELARAGTESQRRQADIRLQRLVGERDFDARVLGGALLPLPPLDAVLAATEQAPEVAQLQRQAQAASHFAQSVAAAANRRSAGRCRVHARSASAARWARSTAGPCRPVWC
jgi:hypothetical protein